MPFMKRVEEEARYDRQLRLWGRSGQQSLAKSHIFLLGATATGAELLKSLVLPGIGRFTIVDDAFVGAEAMGNNFFVEMSDYMEQCPLAEAMVRHLMEMNPQCHGDAQVVSCTSWIDTLTASIPNQAKQQHQQEEEEEEEEENGRIIVATTRVPPASLRELSLHTRLTNTPLLFVHVSGLAGLIHVQCRERLIIDAQPKPDTRVADLRLFQPFPALREWFDAHDPTNDALFASDIELHSHLPWIAILYHALRRLRGEMNAPSFIPQTRADYDQLRRCVGEMMRRPSPPQEGFMEAMEMCRPVLRRAEELPAGVRQLLRRARGTPAPLRSSRRQMWEWAALRGVERFCAAHGMPPLCGYVPDMTTTTPWYTELRAIYAAKHAEDCAAVFAFAMAALRDTARPTGAEGERELLALTEQMVRNVWTLQRVSFGPPLEESDLQPQRFRRYQSACTSMEEHFTVALYAALLAARLFEERHSRPPGTHRTGSEDHMEASGYGDNQWEEDGVELRRFVEAALRASGCKRERGESDESICLACAEVARAGGAEPAATACIVGSVAAQECIKLVQQCRVPVNRPLVFDGYRNCFWLVPSPEEE